VSGVRAAWEEVLIVQSAAIVIVETGEIVEAVETATGETGNAAAADTPRRPPLARRDTAPRSARRSARPIGRGTMRLER
jgi:hypothetical protein